MSEAIPSWARVGAKVVCVDNGPHQSSTGWAEDDDIPSVGGVYTVSNVFTDPYRDVVFHLAELRRGYMSKREWGYDTGYGVWRFRPLVSQSDDIATHFAHLLDTRAPETV